eukprot:1161005-Pelagomonas_calceolata.AAC.9
MAHWQTIQKRALSYPSLPFGSVEKSLSQFHIQHVLSPQPLSLRNMKYGAGIMGPGRSGVECFLEPRQSCTLALHEHVRQCFLFGAILSRSP